MVLKTSNHVIVGLKKVLPVESSCKPTSKASLSVSDRDVVKQLKYWGGGGVQLNSRHEQNLVKIVILCL